MALISFSRNFIFIKTMKTAGTSMEVHLAPHCGSGDIVTRIFPDVPGHIARNYLDSAGNEIFFNHMTARQIEQLVPAAFVGKFKFCFERHPVDKCISHFAMLINSPLHMKPDNAKTWSEYLERQNFPISTHQYINSDGRLMVDKIYKYEDLSDALRDIAAKVGIEPSPIKVTEKSGFRYGVTSVADVMDREDQRQIIFEAFKDTLRFVDYG